MDKLRIAVVGCNNMGKKHVAVLRGHFADRVEIAGILNSSVESSARVAAELNVPYFKILMTSTGKPLMRSLWQRRA